jgi:hypothetical protein
VWILGAPDCDVRTIEPATLCFGSADGLATFQCSPPVGNVRFEDVNADGFADLALHFDMALARLSATDTEACLTGTTLDGRRIHGCAPLRIRPANQPHSDVAALDPAGTDDALELLPPGLVAGAGGSLHVRFRLGGPEPAALEVYDVAGRRLAGQDVGALGAGLHEADLALGAAAGRGVYWVRLVQAGRTVARRVLVLAR